MTQTHGTIVPGNPACLHCVLNYAMGKWAEKNARRNDDGEIILDIGEVITKMAELIGELVYQSPDPAVRAKFERFCHECFEASFEHQRTGKVMMVSVNDGRPS